MRTTRKPKSPAKRAGSKPRKSAPATAEPVAVTPKGIKVFCLHSELKALESLVPNPRNPNTHPPEQIKLLAKIIRAQGWRATIVVSTRSGFVVKGHGRMEAGRLIQDETGEEMVPVEYQAYANEADEWADMVADNRLAELSTLDFQAVGGLLKDMQNMPGFDLDMTGFFDFEREPLLQADWTPPPLSGKLEDHQHGRKYAVTEEQGKVIDQALALAKKKNAKVGQKGKDKGKELAMEDADALVLVAQDYIKNNK